MKQKYQKLLELESNWTLTYLIKKHNSGINITKYMEKATVNTIVNDLISNKHNAENIMLWVKNHLNENLRIKYNQTIRSKRKRYFDAENITEKKKNITIDYDAWKLLAEEAEIKKYNLSEMIIFLIRNYKN